MRSKAHGERLVQFTRLGVINCYLVREDDGFTLIDTGMPGSAGGILAAARKHGAPIVRIAITHAHTDHMGSLDALHAALPDAEITVGAREARFLAGDFSLDPDEPQVEPRAMQAGCCTQPTRLLEDGDTLASLQVLAVPGHTPGHLAFFDLRDRTLIVGDSMQTAGGVAVAGTPRPLFPFPATATWHRPSALQSARRMRALNPARLATGHGPVLDDPLDAMDRAIRAAM
jgi:glyoxylase-like metal-dependent hydrolase (beta-lactamase superfamily II)